MSYNWVSASTPQGRERLKELMDKGITVICRSVDGMHDDDPYFVEPEYNIQADVALDYLEFLDPEPQKPHPITIDEMREYCVKWCEGHEEPLDSENWCSARPQHQDRAQSWYICSTFFSANDSADNQIQLVYAIIRAIESGEISQGKEANP